MDDEIGFKKDGTILGEIKMMLEAGVCVKRHRRALGTASHR
jgi:hypothetical protein